MNRTGVGIALWLVMPVLLSGCTQHQEQKKYAVTVQAGDNKVEVSPGDAMEDIEAVIGTGDASRHQETPSCAFQGYAQMYFYDHCELDTYEDVDFVERVYDVYFLDDMITTPEGVYLGMDADEAKEKMGDPEQESSTMLRFSRGDFRVEMVLKEQKIIAITLLPAEG